ncbi:transposase [Wolbachia endosymbiont of Bemisia tabaci]|uniref:transposase n=1 Tax=Wolbachia endosymbiont of Bemisia tabaci TaxID=215173 RepID=UPI000D5594E0|nr:transposase [Wolbachia endosymbiont of Bemisia tabaci]
MKEKLKLPEGYCNSEIFDAYVVVPVFKPGQTIVLDNASFYKAARTKNLIENIGCKILFLPPYSPDLNPILIKHAIRKALQTFWPNIIA